jgi:hypothetical protein
MLSDGAEGGTHLGATREFSLGDPKDLNDYSLEEWARAAEKKQRLFKVDFVMI